ncbi:chromosomal replication initiator protein DnaA [Azoarcus communis]|uniref:Chromosomal replication initiator protein DnaA n=1 Tax=Parazoarcus communis SWub3 = DSM 12120 TaxID=1121029 RepID=A0A323UQZ0_9RHOO|nr:chromosomal replication initiator protein DnaA [Parazoarcus communis]NMG72418.1 chromosomal replication initiator protein DnaA [Parazoarcus communis SWub3 = DSM 12120]PZA14443.1 chromosomal replication initiator protein DnaA [Azoarcus communis] [Parazoarcus communis SWub3 = DSM 12120]
MLSRIVPLTQTTPSVNQDFWPFCLAHLEQELPQQQFNTWIKTLQAVCKVDDGQPSLTLTAPNRFVMQWVRERYMRRIGELGEEFHGVPVQLELQLPAAGAARTPIAPATPVTPANTGNSDAPAAEAAAHAHAQAPAAPQREARPATPAIVRSPEPEVLSGAELAYDKTRLNADFTFDTLVTGRANDLARAAAMQVAQNPGTSYNPLFVYGGVGLGKTHLVHAIGNAVFRHNPRAVVRYVHVEDYYADVVRAYQQKSFDAFKRYYRSLDMLIIDDIQFFNNKNRTQEEFFHAFNALTEAKKQIVITCDTYPKDIQGLEDRLISRFDWGLTVQIEPPELEMRVAILQKKAEALRVSVDDDVAFLIAKNLRSNVRELEGALNKVVAYARFHGRSISLEVAKDALKDLLNAHNRQLSIEHIQKTVADYYKIKVADMHSKKRTRVIARPRQVAMWLAKELTPMSLPAIGEAFGGRDHTTVLHACRTITELRLGDHQLNHDVHVLTQVLRG